MKNHSRLVALNDGDPKRTLYCAHTASGQTGTYKELAQHLAPETRVFAFEATGLRGDVEPHRTVEAAAAAYASKIREVQPAGPYHILGFSTGGLIAFEMARQLAGWGASVGQVVLVDAALFPDKLRPVSMEVYLHRSFWIMLVTILFNKKFEWLFDKNLSEIWKVETFTAPHPFWRLDDEERLQHLVAALPVHSEAPSWRGATLEQVRKYAVFLHSQWHAMRGLYKPQFYSGNVVFFEPKETYDPSSKDLWKGLTAGCQVIEVPGAHLTMMTGEYVAALSVELRRVLSQRVRERSSPDAEAGSARNSGNGLDRSRIG